MKLNSYANINFFAGGVVPSSDALRFNVPPGVLGGIVPFPGGGGTPQIPSGSVIGSNFGKIYICYIFSLLDIIQVFVLFCST